MSDLPVEFKGVLPPPRGFEEWHEAAPEQLIGKAMRDDKGNQVGEITAANFRDDGTIEFTAVMRERLLPLRYALDDEVSLPPEGMAVARLERVDGEE